MIEETWKDIPDFEGIYQASNLGRIRTCEEKTTYTKRHGVRHWKQRILKPKGETYSTGYRVTLWKNGVGRDYLVARLVASAFLGKSNLTVNHIDGNRFNNNINNLEWCSLSENIHKGFETGLYKNQIKITVFDKKTGTINKFRSLSQASQFYGFKPQYFSNWVSKGISENKRFKWEIQL